MNHYQRHTFKNGLELLTVHMPGVKSATVLVMVGAGSRYEPKNINGLSHFLEHMAFKGSKKRPTALEISSTIDSIGGEFNAFTGKDHTGFYIKARAARVPLLIDVLTDMILNPLLKAEEVEREKGVIIEEINMYEDLPMRKIGDVYEELLYGDTSLGRDTAGKPEIIRSLNRKNFIDYMGEYYRPNNAVIIIAGGINKKFKVGSSSFDKAQDKQLTVKELVEKGLGSWKKGTIKKAVTVNDTQNKPAIKLHYKKTEQAHLAFGFRAYSLSDPRRFALMLLSDILGGGMSSRLFIEVRERRGLAYYVKSDLSQYVDVGNFVIQAGLDVKRIDEAIQVIIDQCMGLTDGRFPITQAELTKAKEYQKGRMTLELEDSRSIAGFYGTQEILKRSINTPEDVFKQIDRVKISDLQTIAHQIFKNQQMNLAIIGPFKEKDRFEKLLI